MVNTQYHKRNICLVGLMGSGKTTIGRSLAKRLGMRFVDTDREIEARTGVSIPTIFEIEGEDGFRRREAQVVEQVAKMRDQVIATGGGAVLNPENRANLAACGVVVYLNVPPETLWERTRHDRNRPLLQVDDPLLRIKELFKQRDPLYRDVADIVVDGGRASAHGILCLLSEEMNTRWRP